MVRRQKTTKKTSKVKFDEEALREVERQVSAAEQVSAVDKAYKAVVKEKLSWHRLLFGKQSLDADVSTGQIFQFVVAVMAMTWLACTLVFELDGDPISYIILGVISFVLMEVYFWVFDTTVPSDKSPMAHTVVRKLWNFILGSVTTLVLGGAAVFGKNLSVRFGKLWSIYGEFITGLLLWTGFWLVVLGAIVGVFWLFIKLNSLKYKKKPEPVVPYDPLGMSEEKKEDDNEGGVQ